MRPRLLPTLLGSLVLLAGLLAFVRSSPPTPPPPAQVTLEEAPTTTFEATLVGIDETGERVRQETLPSYPEPGAQLTESLRALRTWSVAEGRWPDALGAPRVFLVTPSHAVLDFPLTGAPQLSAAAEARLIASLRRTAARRGVSDITLLVGGRAPETFLGHVALTDTLDADVREVAEPGGAAE